MNTQGNQAMDVLRKGFTREVLLPGGPAYDEARTLFNSMIDKHPAVIAQCSSVDDMVRAVQFGRDSGLLASSTQALVWQGVIRLKRYRVLYMLFLVLLLASCSNPETGGLDSLSRPAGPSLTTLGPGKKVEINQNLQINVVFVGYETADINESAFFSLLPEAYRTIQRFPAFYGDLNFMGNDFTYDYNLVYADTTFENELFAYLASIGEVGAPTIFQQCYSGTAPEGTPACTNQTQNELAIDETLYLDAPSVEAWLITHAPVDTTQYTVFLINWYGREDFQYHVYTKTDEGAVDPDTGYNFGTQRDSRKLIAWGGTPNDDNHRVWFHDLSAGPESWTDNWNVDNADLNGNGQVDYRMPPIWEYGTDGWWQSVDEIVVGPGLSWEPVTLSTDLALITRFVFLDLLATTSPLYDPALSPPELPDSIQVDINLYNIDPTIDASVYFDLEMIAEELEALRPYNDFTAEINEIPFTSRAEQIYRCFITNHSCFGNRLFGIAFGDLFLYASDQLIRFLEGDADYELPVFSYFDQELLGAGGLLGFADDDWRTGTQSFVFQFLDPYLVFLGFGFTSTTIHEAGHHLGVSHPHDGFDWEAGVDFGPGDAFYFVWLGDESDTVMSYLGLSINFSQFDRDNMNRYMTTVYLNYANVILEKVYKSPRVSQVSNLLRQADALAGQAVTQYLTMRYKEAAFTAEEAYRLVLQAAKEINIQIEPQAWQADYKSKGRSSKFVDDVNDHMNRP